MRREQLITMLLFGAVCFAHAFDPEKASTERFIVAFVEPDSLPAVSEIPEKLRQRFVKEATETETPPEALEHLYRNFLRNCYFPIRVTDTKSGNIYEVQNDRRTITARTHDGKLLWQVNPFVDSKLKPYRVEHPIIDYIGRITLRANRVGEALGVGFSGSQFGELNLADGSFKYVGRD